MPDPTAVYKTLFAIRQEVFFISRHFSKVISH